MSNLEISKCVCGETPLLTRDLTSVIIHPHYVKCTCGRTGPHGFHENNAIFLWNKTQMDKCPKCGNPDVYQTIKNKRIIECGECKHQFTDNPAYTY